MKRKKVDPQLIDYRDASAKEFVWLVLPDGTKVLYGIKRLAIKYRLSVQTILYRWKVLGRPDEIPMSMLAPTSNSYKMRSTGKIAEVDKRVKPPAAKQEPKQPKQKPFLLLPDNTRHTATELSYLFDVPASTLASRKKVGKTEITRSELKGMKRKDRQVFAEQADFSPSAIPRNIHEVEYNPSAAERAMLRF